MLTRGSRGAPTRQQTLSWSVGWSYDLCTPAEQRLWAELSVFAGSFELEAAEGICTGDLVPGELLDLVSALVDKSILSRIDAGGAARFRMLDTLRDYGSERIDGNGDLLELHRRHADWFRRFVRDAAADWFGPRQVQWMQRLDREALNIREALEFSLTDSPETALQIVGTIHPFGVARGRLTEIRHWLDRTLAATPAEPTVDRINALYGDVAIAALQGDLPAAVAWLEQAQDLVAQMTDAEARGKVAIAEGFTALVGGDSDRACDRFEDALSCIDDPSLRVSAMILLGWCLEFSGEIGRALLWQEKALAIAESHDESVYRGYALWSLGIGWWRHRKPDRAAELLKDALRLNEVVDDPRQAAASLEGLAWIAAEKDDTVRAAVLMAAAQGLGRTVGASTVVLPHLQVFHDKCERRTKEALDAEAFEAARQQGCAMSFEEAVAYAVAESS